MFIVGSSYIKYSNGIEKLINLVHSQPRDSQTYGYWFYGPTGTGKSRKAHSLSEGSYVKDPSNKWFDGYNHNGQMIIDDFRPNKDLTFQMLLTLTDRYPMSVERKGGTMQFNTRRIIITTPHDIDTTFAHLEFLQGSLAQLKRRYKEVRFGEGTISQHLTLKDFPEGPDWETSPITVEDRLSTGVVPDPLDRIIADTEDYTAEF